VFDVLTRKLGFQLPGLGSTRLQELEWHLHTALFSFWLGTAYIKNAHVRIDIAVAGAAPRTQAWIELLGVLVFALPYCLVAIYFSYDFTRTAWIFNEYSDSATGLPWRWIPKGIITAGLVLLLAAVVSVGLRTVAGLWKPPPERAA
jgi:TRAP-type mannitol/chloroaromatic compound transport system permease small subunit